MEARVLEFHVKPEKQTGLNHQQMSAIDRLAMRWVVEIPVTVNLGTRHMAPQLHTHAFQLVFGHRTNKKQLVSVAAMCCQQNRPSRLVVYNLDGTVTEEKEFPDG